MRKIAQSPLAELNQHADAARGMMIGVLATQLAHDALLTEALTGLTLALPEGSMRDNFISHLRARASLFSTLETAAPDTDHADRGLTAAQIACEARERMLRFIDSVSARAAELSKPAGHA